METPVEMILTTKHKKDILAWLAAHPDGFDEVVKLAIKDKPPYSWRAAWILWSGMQENDARIRRQLKKMIQVIPERPYNQQRELLMILQRMEIPEDSEGMLFDHCVTIWENIGQQPSVRMNAIRMIVTIAKRHTELAQEMVHLLQPQYLETLSPGVKWSVGKLMKEWK